ncbi:luciferase family protein [Patulibacter sp.]|uniref:luciferase domain-containing protein n=1 Tax=Patulibacter sp. TaxID=1912859 RepID=UPI0027266CFA|nr:luciferase family protein [Patulibacter sp.]MDO9408302.1 DUF5519 family protein [Patulibacter sp.]
MSVPEHPVPESPAAAGPDRPASVGPVGGPAASSPDVHPRGVPGALDAVTAEATAWEGVSTTTGDRGEWSFRLGRREIGHLHGDRVLHLAFPKAVWHELHEAGRITFHPVFPGRVGWAARAIHDEADVRDVVALLRINYDRERERHPRAAA